MSVRGPSFTLSRCSADPRDMLMRSMRLRNIFRFKFLFAVCIVTSSALLLSMLRGGIAFRVFFWVFALFLSYL